MITGMVNPLKKETVSDYLLILNNFDNIQFNTIGSRYFQTHNKNSDFNLLQTTSYDTYTAKKLKELGFKLVTNTYNKKYIEFVFELICSDGKIQIQIPNYYYTNKIIKVRNLLSESNLIKTLNKTQINELFTLFLGTI